MKHYELLKLTPGTDAVAVQEKIWKAYDRLDAELDWLNRPVVCRGCGINDSDPDIMAVFELEDEAQLQAYLAHPLRGKLEEELKPVTAAKTCFDHY